MVFVRGKELVPRQKRVVSKTGAVGSVLGGGDGGCTEARSIGLVSMYISSDTKLGKNSSKQTRGVAWNTWMLLRSRDSPCQCCHCKLFYSLYMALYCIFLLFQPHQPWYSNPIRPLNTRDNLPQTTRYSLVHTPSPRTWGLEAEIAPEPRI